MWARHLPPENAHLVQSFSLHLVDILSRLMRTYGRYPHRSVPSKGQLFERTYVVLHTYICNNNNARKWRRYMRCYSLLLPRLLRRAVKEVQRWQQGERERAAAGAVHHTALSVPT